MSNEDLKIDEQVLELRSSYAESSQKREGGIFEQDKLARYLTSERVFSLKEECFF